MRPKHVSELLTVANYINELEEQNATLKHDLDVERLRIERMVSAVRKLEIPREDLEEFNNVLPFNMKIDSRAWWIKMTGSERDEMLLKYKTALTGFKQDEDVIYKMFQLEKRSDNG